MSGRLKCMLAALALVVLLTTVVVPGQAMAASRSTVHVLMIGNSLTRSNDGTNTTVTHLKRLAAKQGITLDVEVLAYGASDLQKYAEGSYASAVKRAITRKKWDYIVLQENQDVQIGKYSRYLNGARKLYSYIRKNAPKSKVYLNAVWGERRGGRFYGTYYNPRAQKNCIFRNTDKVADSLGIPRRQIIYSGKAFWEYDSLPDKGNRRNLYSDREHGSNDGYYLNALCIGHRILPKPVSRVWYYGAVGKPEAKLMMRVVERYNPR